MTHITQITLLLAAVGTTLLLSACNYQEKPLSNDRAAIPQPAPINKIQSNDENRRFVDSEAPQESVAAAGDVQIAVRPPLQDHAGIQTTQQSLIHRTIPVQEVIAVPVPSETEKYASIGDNKTILTIDEPVSTFSIDVDTGSYANVRRFLQAGQLPPRDAVRVEEMLNYFSYDYPNSASRQQPFSVVTELGPTPWNDNTQILHIGLQGYVPADLETQAANLVFLIDVSGSMNQPDKLGLLKSSISLLTHELDESDTVSIVVYAGSSGTVLEPTAGNEHARIDRALARLQAGGSTNGAAGIQLAYQLAAEHFVEGGINRVILATDGDFNVGMSDTAELKALIKQKRESGVALTTLGFGTGNYNDHLMEQLADTGNGSYAYIDTLGEARKVLVEELNATLLTIAKDVKIQVEFNPAVVSEYRLIGYTNRQLHNEDFNNDKVDAGEIGAGHTVTALYEVALQGSGGQRHSVRRYGQTNSSDSTGTKLNELAELRLRYKSPSSEASQLISQIVETRHFSPSLAHTSDNFRFSASVAAFGQLLRDNHRLNSFAYEDAKTLASQASGIDSFGYRSEYIRLLDMADSLDRLRRASNDHRRIDEG